MPGKMLTFLCRELPAYRLGGFSKQTACKMVGRSTCSASAFEYIIQNRAWFQAFLVDQPNSRFVTRWRDAIKANFAQRYPQATTRPNWDLLAEMGASAAVGAYAYWMQHPENVDIHEVKGLVDRALTAVMDI